MDLYISKYILHLGKKYIYGQEDVHLFKNIFCRQWGGEKLNGTCLFVNIFYIEVKKTKRKVIIYS